ncbi:MAG: hypothetical protein HamCj_04140 [Candidatus Hamiltonella defensa (Ceratovacuna japonica)]
MRHQYLVFRTYYVTILMSFSYINTGVKMDKKHKLPYSPEFKLEGAQ